MSRITVTRTIEAPVERVFEVITDIERLPETSADVVKVEFLTEQRSGPGTRFRETRSSKGREAKTELELTEVVANERARFVSDAGGTIWDTVFSFRTVPPGSATELRIELEARPRKLLSKLMLPLVRGMVRRGMENHIDDLKAYCEAEG